MNARKSATKIIAFIVIWKKTLNYNISFFSFNLLCVVKIAFWAFDKFSVLLVSVKLLALITVNANIFTNWRHCGNQFIHFLCKSNHIRVIKALASKANGLDRQEILRKTKMSDGGWFSNLLDELEKSGFISTHKPLEKKKKDTLYRLTDEFSLFYLNFMEGKKLSRGNSWMKISQTQDYKIWCGYAFENICIKHVDEIKEALGVSGVESDVNSYLHRKDKVYEKGFQIDLLIDRKDDVINICEMKFYSDEFKIDSDYANKLRIKKEGLKAVTKTKRMVHITFISTYGVFENQYKIDLVDNDLTIEIFFN